MAYKHETKYIKKEKIFIHMKSHGGNLAPQWPKNQTALQAAPWALQCTGSGIVAIHGRAAAAETPNAT